MKCQNCLRLEDRIRVLEERVGLVRRTGSLASLVVHLDVTLTQASILLRLYSGRGEALTTEALADAMGTSSIPSLKSTIYDLRKRLGEDTIDAVRGRGASGYWLTPKGLSLVLGALERPEFQDVRG